MGITSSKYWCSCLRPQPSSTFPELKPLYPDVIDPITAVCVPFSPGAIPRDIGASVYGSRHTFTRVTVGNMAHRAGVREGDQLISVNFENVEILRHDQLIKLFVGIEETLHLEMRRLSGGSDASSASTSDTEIITVQLEVKEMNEVIPDQQAIEDLEPRQVTLMYDVHGRTLNQLQHQYGPWGGAILPGSRGRARKARLNTSNISDATIAVHSFKTISPTGRGTYVVLEFDKIHKFFTCSGGNIRIQSGGQPLEIESTEDARVFLMTDAGRGDLKFQSTKYPGKFLTMDNGVVKLKSRGATIERQYFKLHRI